MIATWERNYLKVLYELHRLATMGQWKENRTANRTVGGFGLQLDIPLAAGALPAMVTKTVHLKSVIHELLWFLAGETNTAYLREHGVTIWDEWANENGDLGPVYGQQWRSWRYSDGVIDQVKKLIDDLKQRPNSRRIIVSAWNPADLPDESLPPQENVLLGNQALAPCHMLFQAYVHPLSHAERLWACAGNGMPLEVAAEIPKFGEAQASQMMDQYGIPRRGLQLRVDQRSADWVLGVPFNILSYALLTHMLCQIVPDLTPTRLVMQFGDYHLYENQVEAAEEQISRGTKVAGAGQFRGEPTVQGEQLIPHPLAYPSVKFHQVDQWRNLDNVSFSDVEVTDYAPWGRIVAPVSI